MKEIGATAQCSRDAAGAARSGRWRPAPRRRTRRRCRRRPRRRPGCAASAATIRKISDQRDRHQQRRVAADQVLQVGGCGSDAGDVDAGRGERALLGRFVHRGSIWPARWRRRRPTRVRRRRPAGRWRGRRATSTCPAQPATADLTAPAAACRNRRRRCPETACRSRCR